jgi:hypothetical protein
MKKLLLLISLLSLSSCKLVKQVMDEEITLKEAEVQDFELVENNIFTVSKIDGHPNLFKFDTGATSSIIYDTTMVENYYQLGKSKFGITKDAQRKRISIERFPVSFENGLFSSPNYLMK